MKKCLYCNEIMKYGKRWQNCALFINKKFAKQFDYEQIGWWCNMNNDYCDFVIDPKMEKENKQLYEMAKNEINAKFD